MKTLPRHKFYIVDSTDINNIFAYNKGFLTKRRAQAAIDAYLDPDRLISIMSGTEVVLSKLRIKKASFTMHSPRIKRRPNVRASINNAKKRERLKGTGIITHKFKENWDPLPSDPVERKKFFNKDRDKIRNRILK